jgi:fructoselysine-6-P-deglycase FrlB-like protein
VAQPSEMTDDERKAIAALQRLAKRWPKSLMLASMGGSLYVISTFDHAFDDEVGGHVGVDPDKVLTYIDGIPNTGGDW